MARHIFAGMFLAAPSTATIVFVGHGTCMDQDYQEFNRFTAPGQAEPGQPHLHSLLVHDLSECSCPECDDFCKATPECIGYEFYCCIDDGVRCNGGASVLFQKGTRPVGEPSPPFSTSPWMRQFEGVGQITSAVCGDGGCPARKCFSKIPTKELV